MSVQKKPSTFSNEAESETEKKNNTILDLKWIIIIKLGAQHLQYKKKYQLLDTASFQFDCAPQRSVMASLKLILHINFRK